MTLFSGPQVFTGDQAEGLERQGEAGRMERALGWDGVVIT